MNDDEPTKEPEPRPASGAGRRALARIRSGVAAAKDPVVDRLGQAGRDVERSWSERPGARGAARPPDGIEPAAVPVQPPSGGPQRAAHIDVGLQTVDIGEIAGTAVGGGAHAVGGDTKHLRKGWRRCSRPIEVAVGAKRQASLRVSALGARIACTKHVKILEQAGFAHSVEHSVVAADPTVECRAV